MSEEKFDIYEREKIECRVCGSYAKGFAFHKENQIDNNYELCMTCIMELYDNIMGHTIGDHEDLKPYFIR